MRAFWVVCTVLAVLVGLSGCGKEVADQDLSPKKDLAEKIADGESVDGKDVIPK